MVTIQIHTESPLLAIGALGKVVEWSRQRYAGEDDYIVLGRFNAGCGYANEVNVNGS